MWILTDAEIGELEYACAVYDGANQNFAGRKYATEQLALYVGAMQDGEYELADTLGSNPDLVAALGHTTPERFLGWK